MRSIRRASLQDIESVHVIFARAISGARWLPPEARLAADFATVSKGETIVVCCSPEGRVLGFVSVFEPDSFIHHLYVADDCQRQGVGTSLLKSLEAWFPMPWHLKCVAQNESALAYYLSRGWAEVDRAQGSEGPYVLLKRSTA